MRRPSGTNCFPSRPPCRPPELAPCSPRCSLTSSLRRHAARAPCGRWRRHHARKFGGRPLPANVALRHDRGGRESCTVQESREVEVGESDQWRQSAFGVDGEYTRLQGHQATSILQTVRGEAGSITRRAGGCQASARRDCRRRRRINWPRDRPGALATPQLPAWRALVLPLQLHQAKDGDQAGFSMVCAASSIYGRPVAPRLRRLCLDGCQPPQGEARTAAWERLARLSFRPLRLLIPWRMGPDA